MPEPSALKLWDDDPSLIDLLGFDAVVGPIVDGNCRCMHAWPIPPWDDGTGESASSTGYRMAARPAFAVRGVAERTSAIEVRSRRGLVS
jgi:hypothetical protein